MPKPCKKSASSKPVKQFSLEERYAMADLKEQIRKTKKLVKAGPERNARIAALKKQLKQMKSSAKKENESTKMSLAAFDAKYGTTVPNGDEDDTSVSEDSD